MCQRDETPRAEELARILAAKEAHDGTAYEVFGRVAHRAFLFAIARGARAASVSGFRLRRFAFGNHKIVRLGPGGCDRKAAEPCPQLMQPSPRLASQASRSWSHSEAPLQ